MLDLVLEALLPYAGAAEVTLVWGDRAGMWFTQVRPRNSRAASLDIAVEENTINITVGRTWFEVVGDVQESLPYLRDLVDAVFAGAVEESGWKETPSPASGPGTGWCRLAQCTCRCRGDCAGCVGTSPIRRQLAGLTAA